MATVLAGSRRLGGYHRGGSPRRARFEQPAVDSLTQGAAQ